MDWQSIITELGGGLSAVVIVVQGFAIYQMWRRLTEVQDKRVDDARDHASQMQDVIAATGDVVRAMEARRNV